MKKNIRHIYFLLLQVVLAVLPAIGQERLIIHNTSPVYIALANGVKATPTYLVVHNGATDGITLTSAATNSGILSEGEFNMVEWDIGTAAAASSYVLPFFYFPSTSYIPLTLTIKTAGTNAAGVIRFSTWHTQADDWTGTVSSTGPPSDVTNMHVLIGTGAPSATDNSYNVVDRFWVTDAGTGYTTKPDPQLTFTYLSTGNAASEVSGANNAIDGTLIAQRFNTTSGTWGDYLGQTGTTAAGTGANTKTVASGTTDVTAAGFFRSWTLSSKNSPLPIQLISFTAECNNYYAMLQWTTATESNNNFFTIDRTQDGEHFETVAIVKGAGNSSTANTYSAIDYTPLAGVSYYRISQTDFDGTITHVSTIVYKPCENTQSVNAFAANNTINIQINALSAGPYTFTLMNTLGQVILCESKNATLGLNDYKLEPQVVGGIYILQIAGKEKVYCKKLYLGSL